ncbi:hypothetical protein LSTR_LSTR010255 [Laodelphax striatellus]|uniref:Uncharacterized protein n=1 Tax=Laodelphax striatellus TaxID=195883 RepID=A0A482WM73_LAOST|nr:hypothetical protein LSTR_LSTR010255 [Laodelphax striatellus]
MSIRPIRSVVAKTTRASVVCLSLQLRSQTIALSEPRRNVDGRLPRKWASSGASGLRSQDRQISTTRKQNSNWYNESSTPLKLMQVSRRLAMYAPWWHKEKLKQICCACQAYCARQRETARTKQTDLTQDKKQTNSNWYDETSTPLKLMRVSRRLAVDAPLVGIKRN